LSYAALEYLLEANTEWEWIPQCLQEMRNVDATTGIMYMVPNPMKDYHNDGLAKDSHRQHEHGVEAMHETSIQGPEIHLLRWSGTRGHVSKDDCDDIHCHLYEVYPVFFDEAHEGHG
jgi:hypothetical protein